MREDGSSWTIRTIEAGAGLPPSTMVSAVFLLAINGDAILAVRNERGWDIPGGHIEPGESAVAALEREVMEESAASFVWAEPFAVIGTAERADGMLIYTTDAFTLSEFTPTADALERAMIPVQCLLDLYCGPTKLLQTLVDQARARLRLGLR